MRGWEGERECLLCNLGRAEFKFILQTSCALPEPVSSGGPTQARSPPPPAAAVRTRPVLDMFWGGGGGVLGDGEPPEDASLIFGAGTL